MWKPPDQLEILRSGEHARIARWLREGEYGHMYYDRKGRAHRISAEEALELEQTAKRRLERYIEHIRGLEARCFATTFGGFAAFLVAGMALPPRLDWLAPYAVLPFAIYFLHEAGAGLRYTLARNAWRDAQAARFRARTPVPAAVEAHHRRYNLFRWGSYACALGAVAHVFWLTFTVGPEGGFGPATMVLMGLAWLFYLPANRIDATHRRRKWLD